MDEFGVGGPEEIYLFVLDGYESKISRAQQPQ